MSQEEWDKLTPDEQKKAYELQKMGFSPEPGVEKRISSALGTPAASQDVQKIYGALAPALHKLFHPTEKAAAKTKTKSGGGGPISESDALKQLAQDLLSNYASNLPVQGEIAAGEEGQQLANQNAAVTNAVSSELGAAGAAGNASGDPAIAAAMGAYNTAYQTGEGFNSAAYQNMSNANAQYLASSPLAPIVNMLTSGLGSNYYKQLPPSLVNSLPQSVRQVLAGQGISESTGQPSGTGTPINTGPNPTGTGNQGLNLSTILSNIQNTGTNTTQTSPTGNPNTPGA
jgi:hypothetical protein